MNPKQIDTHLATFKEFDSSKFDMQYMNELQKLQIKNSILCSTWAKVGPAIMFVFRSFLLKKLRPGWALAAEALNMTFNGLCEIPQPEN